MSKCENKDHNKAFNCKHKRSSNSEHYSFYYKQKVKEVNCNLCGKMTFYHDGEIIDDENIKIKIEDVNSLFKDSRNDDSDDIYNDVIISDEDDSFLMSNGQLLI